MELTNLEARVIGCLLEKEITTPDQYPLSLNALTLACNQKTSREPVMSLTESEVQQILDDLNKKRLINEQSGFGSRVVKYKHRFCNTEFSNLQLSPQQVAIIDLLLLRGPQTVGELRTRGGRLYEFSDIKQVEDVLTELSQFETPLVKLLPKEPGKREARYTECLSIAGKSCEASLASLPQLQKSSESYSNGIEQRVDALELEVAELKEQITKILQASQSNE